MARKLAFPEGGITYGLLDAFWKTDRKLERGRQSENFGFGKPVWEDPLSGRRFSLNMGGFWSSSVSIRVTISNGHNDVMYVSVVHESPEENPFFKGPEWYKHARYFQRVASGDSRSIDLVFSSSEKLWYITLGSESGKQIVDGLSKNVSVQNVIVNEKGTLINARDGLKWVDEDGVSHKPSGERRMLTDQGRKPQPGNFVLLKAELPNPGKPGVKISAATPA